MNANGQTITEIKVAPSNLAFLLENIQSDQVNTPTGKNILARTFESGEKAEDIIKQGHFGQISDLETLSNIIDTVLSTNPQEVAAYRAGKTPLWQWFFGQVMAATRGQANPSLVEDLLKEKL